MKTTDTANQIVSRLQARREQARKFRDQAAAENRPELEREWQARSEAYGNAIKIALEVADEN